MCTRVTALGSIAIVSAVLLAGCGGHTAKANSKPYDSSDPSMSASRSSATRLPARNSPTTNPSKAAASTRASTKPKKQTKVANQLAPATIKPVIRNGKVPHPTIKAAAAAIDGTVDYTDGVTLKITRITHGKVTGKGPGIVQGPVTTFFVTLHNGSAKTLDLDQVVVTTVYGSPARISSPVYVAKSQDFSGNIKAGKDAKAVYSFMSSTTHAAKVTVHVDFDGRHTAAVFTGSAD